MESVTEKELVTVEGGSWLGVLGMSLLGGLIVLGLNAIVESNWLYGGR